MGIKPSYNKVEFTQKELEQMVDKAVITINEMILLRKHYIESDEKELLSLLNKPLPEKIVVDGSIIQEISNTIYAYSQLRGGIFYEPTSFKEKKVMPILALEEIIAQAELVQGFGCAIAIKNLVKSLLIEKFSEICVDFTGADHEKLISKAVENISDTVLDHREKHLDRINKLNYLDEQLKSGQDNIVYYTKQLAQFTDHKSEVLKPLSDRAEKYKQYIEKNGYYTKSSVIKALDTMNKETFEAAKATGAIKTTCPFEDLQNETSFEAQLKALDLSELENIVFCWPNTGQASFLPLPLDTCCASDHKVVDHTAVTNIKTLYTDLYGGSVHLNKFDLRNKEMWKKLAEQLGGHKIKSIVDCADSGWSQPPCGQKGNTQDFIELTKYIQDNILAKNGKIILSIGVESITPLDFEKFYDSALSGDTHDHYHG